MLPVLPYPGGITEEEDAGKIIFMKAWDERPRRLGSVHPRRLTASPQKNGKQP